MRLWQKTNNFDVGLHGISIIQRMNFGPFARIVLKKKKVKRLECYFRSLKKYLIMKHQLHGFSIKTELAEFRPFRQNSANSVHVRSHYVSKEIGHSIFLNFYCSRRNILKAKFSPFRPAGVLFAEHFHHPIYRAYGHQFLSE